MENFLLQGHVQIRDLLSITNKECWESDLGLWPCSNQIRVGTCTTLDTSCRLIKNSLTEKIGNHRWTKSWQVRFKVNPWIFLFYLISLVPFCFAFLGDEVSWSIYMKYSALLFLASLSLKFEKAMNYFLTWL